MSSHKSRLMVMVMGLLLGAMAVGVALAQTSNSFDVRWNVLGGGGGGLGSESFAADGTVGQVAVGASASTNFRLDAGFWPGVAAAAPVGGETPTPTATPAATIFGDVDCDGDIDAVDAQKELRHIVALAVSQTEPCPDIGSGVAPMFGDVDCDGDVDAVDSLKIQRFVAGLPVIQQPGCPAIGV